jgi:hypothetical protein
MPRHRPFRDPPSRASSTQSPCRDRTSGKGAAVPKRGPPQSRLRDSVTALVHVRLGSAGEAKAPQRYRRKALFSKELGLDGAAREEILPRLARLLAC